MKYINNTPTMIYLGRKVILPFATVEVTSENSIEYTEVMEYVSKGIMSQIEETKPATSEKQESTKVVEEKPKAEKQKKTKKDSE